MLRKKNFVNVKKGKKSNLFMRADLVVIDAASQLK